MSDERSLEEVRAEVIGRLGLGEAPPTLETALAALEERDILDKYVPCPFVGLDGCQGRRIPAKPTCLNCLRFHRHDFLTEAEFPLDGGLQVDQLTGEQAVLLAAVRQAAHQATIEHFVAKALIPEGHVTCPHKRSEGCLGHRPKRDPTCDPCREAGRSEAAWAEITADERRAELTQPRDGANFTDYQVECGGGPVIGAGPNHVAEPWISRSRKVGVRSARRSRDRRIRRLAEGKSGGVILCEGCAEALVVLASTSRDKVDLLSPKRCAWEGCTHHTYHELCAAHYGAVLVGEANGTVTTPLRQDSFRRSREDGGKKK